MTDCVCTAMSAPVPRNAMTQAAACATIDISVYQSKIVVHSEILAEVRSMPHGTGCKVIYWFGPRRRQRRLSSSKKKPQKKHAT